MEPTKHVAKQSSCCWIPLGALSGLVCVLTQHLQATIGESSVSRHLHTRIAARVCETSGRAAENRATLEPTKHVAKQSSWGQIPLGALSGLVCVPTQRLQTTIGEYSLSRHLHTRIAQKCKREVALSSASASRQCDTTQLMRCIIQTHGNTLKRFYTMGSQTMSFRFGYSRYA